MDDVFVSGRLVDLILVLVAIEVVVLIMLWRRRGRGIPPADLLPNVLAGVFLLLTLRVVLAGGGWTIGCICLAAAGVAHLVDLVRRWRRET